MDDSVDLTPWDKLVHKLNRPFTMKVEFVDKCIKTFLDAQLASADDVAIVRTYWPKNKAFQREIFQSLFYQATVLTSVSVAVITYSYGIGAAIFVPRIIKFGRDNVQRYKLRKSREGVDDLAKVLRKQFDLNMYVLEYLDHRVDNLEGIRYGLGYYACQPIVKRDITFCVNVCLNLMNICLKLRNFVLYLGETTGSTEKPYDSFCDWCFQTFFFKEGDDLIDVIFYMQRLSQMYMNLTSALVSTFAVSMRYNIWAKNEVFNEIMNVKIPELLEQLTPRILDNIDCYMNVTALEMPKYGYTDEDRFTIYYDGIKRCAENLNGLFENIGVIEGVLEQNPEIIATQFEEHLKDLQIKFHTITTNICYISKLNDIELGLDDSEETISITDLETTFEEEEEEDEIEVVDDEQQKNELVLELRGVQSSDSSSTEEDIFNQNTEEEEELEEESESTESDNDLDATKTGRHCGLSARRTLKFEEKPY